MNTTTKSVMPVLLIAALFTTACQQEASVEEPDDDFEIGRKYLDKWFVKEVGHNGI